VRPLRGNLDTRLGKLDRGEYDAIVLAAAGLKRLGLAERIRALLPVSVSLPAAGQGALGIETLAQRDDMAAWLGPLVHEPTWLQVRAERVVSRVLGGSCRVPLAAYCEPTPENGLWLRACVASVDGEHLIEAQGRAALASVESAEQLGADVAADLLAQGAQAYLQPS
jgi:hydroxymethylbilane synthase